MLDFLFNKQHAKETSGFTLIELLLTIAIISLLATFVLRSLFGVSRKASEVKHMAEIKAVVQALELYYNDHGNYPDVGTKYVLFSNSTFRNMLKPYMKQLPEKRANQGIPYDTYYSLEDFPGDLCTPDSGAYIIHFAFKDKKLKPYYYETHVDGKTGTVYYFHCIKN